MWLKRWLTISTGIEGTWPWWPTWPTFARGTDLQLAMAVCFAESVTTWVFPLLGRCSIFHRNEENRAQNHMIYHQSPHSLATKYREADSDTYVNLRLGAVEAVETEGPVENRQVCRWIKLEDHGRSTIWVFSKLGKDVFCQFIVRHWQLYGPVSSSEVLWNEEIARISQATCGPQKSEACDLADRVTFTWEPETLWMVQGGAP